MLGKESTNYHVNDKIWQKKKQSISNVYSPHFIKKNKIKKKQNTKNTNKKPLTQTAGDDATRSHFPSYLVLKVAIESQSRMAHPALATFPAQYITSSSQEVKTQQQKNILKAYFPGKGRELLLFFAHHHQHAGSGQAWRKSKDLIHQQTKESNCTEQEKTTNWKGKVWREPKKCNYQSEVFCGVQERTILKHQWINHCTYRREPTSQSFRVAHAEH